MGKPMIWLEAAVLNEKGDEVGPGVHGQLKFKGRIPNLIFKEYFNKPEATADAIRDGWFHSGDIVYYDENGIYYFVDRIGGFIRVRGENLSSHTVEGLLSAHPAVNSSAVFPVQAAEGGEEDIAAFIVLNEGAELLEEDFRSWIKTELPKYMWPKHIRFVDTLPVTPSFKVEKYKLKARIMEELGL
jgi:crotonobetaine/carnitine-CoA ligase